MEQLVVLDKTGKADYVEWDINDMSKEDMIEVLKEDDGVSAIYETITNTGPQGLIWEREKVIKDAMPEDEYERLVNQAKHKQILELYDFNDKTAKLYEKVYKDLDLPIDEEYICHPDVLKDPEKMEEFYQTLRRNILEYINADEDNNFDLRDGEFRDLLNMFDIIKVYQ